MLCLGVADGTGEANLAFASDRVHDWSASDRRGEPGELPDGMLSGLEFGLVMIVSPCMLFPAELGMTGAGKDRGYR